MDPTTSKRQPLSPSTSRTNVKDPLVRTSIAPGSVSALRRQFSRESFIVPPSPTKSLMRSPSPSKSLMRSPSPSKSLSNSNVQVGQNHTPTNRPKSLFMLPATPESNMTTLSNLSKSPSSYMSTPRSLSRQSTITNMTSDTTSTSLSSQFLSIPPESSNTKSENVFVCVRVRPALENESDIGTASSGNSDIRTNIVNGAWQINRLTNSISSADGSKRMHEFQFDAALTGSDNAVLYKTVVAKHVKACMEGYPTTVFAYGQTNSGKTFSMMGRDNQPGVIPRAVEDVFAYILENNDREFLLRVSYLEIYNETLRDLLSPENSDLRIHEDKRRGVYVSPLREEIVTSPRQVLRVIQRGESHRHTSTTDFNEHSSRSHTIFTMIIESRQRTGTPQSTPRRRLSSSRGTGGGTGVSGGGNGSVHISHLNLIDLAGSEKASSQLERRKEGAYINKSLLTLGNVIARITENKDGHIPFRDSKLTRILQSSLSGNAKISVICTISPTSHAYEESVNTLKFAQRVKKVVTNASLREIPDDKALIQKYRMEIAELKAKLAATTDTLSTDRDKELEQLEQLKQAKVKHEEEMAEMQLIRTAFKERIDHLTRLILTSSSVSRGGDLTLSGIPNSNSSSLSGGLINDRLSSELEKKLAEKDAKITKLEQIIKELKVIVSQQDEAYPAMKILREEVNKEKNLRIEEEKKFKEIISRLEAELDDVKQELLIRKLTNASLN